MNDGGATDQTKDEAWEQSRSCRFCHGSGQASVFHPHYDGSAVMMFECVDRDGEIRPKPVAVRVVAHCMCPMGRWMRSKTERLLLSRIPDLLDVLAGRSRWVADDPMGDRPYQGPELSVQEMKRRVAKGATP